MINKNQLRHGNIVSYDGEMWVIYDLGYSEVGLQDHNGNMLAAVIHYEDICPVELTGGILERCGFYVHRIEKNEYLHYGSATETKHYENTDQDDDPRKFDVSITTNSRDNTSAINCRFRYGLKYLHEFQNIYFYNTNAELEMPPFNTILCD